MQSILSCFFISQRFKGQFKDYKIFPNCFLILHFYKEPNLIIKANSITRSNLNYKADQYEETNRNFQM